MKNMSDPIKKPLGPALAGGILKTNGREFSVHALGAEWLEDIHALHDRVAGGLPDNRKSDLASKTRDDFEQYLQDGGIVVGAVSEGRLIAKALLHRPTAQNPDNGMVDMPVGPPIEKTAYFQSDTVDPDFQGNGIVQKLMHVRLTLAMLHGREYVCSEVAVGNTPCLKAFFNCGFAVDSMGTDAADGTRVYNLFETTQKAMLRTAFNAAAAKDDGHAIDLSDHDRISRKLEEGYRGVAIDSKNNKMIFAPKK